MNYCPDCLKTDCECPPVSIKIAALEARAERSEALLREAQDGWAEARSLPLATLLAVIDEAPVQRKLALALYAAGDFAAAVRPLMLALRKSPDEAELHLKAALARAVEEMDDYRAKAIQRQQDFDGAAHACDVLQGKLDKATEERDAAMRNHGECGMALSAVVEERDAALVLLHALEEFLRLAPESQPESPAFKAFTLLRERGLLRGERG